MECDTIIAGWNRTKPQTVYGYFRLSLVRLIGGGLKGRVRWALISKFASHSRAARDGATSIKKDSQLSMGNELALIWTEGFLWIELELSRMNAKGCQRGRSNDHS